MVFFFNTLYNNKRNMEQIKYKMIIKEIKKIAKELNIKFTKWEKTKIKNINDYYAILKTDYIKTEIFDIQLVLFTKVSVLYKNNSPEYINYSNKINNLI